MLNILQAKLTQIMGFKAVKFQSIQNIGRFTPLAYFAFNFVPSGGAKNRLLSEIDLNLLNFFNDYLKKYNEERLEKLECEQTLRLQKITDKVELRRKKMECDAEIKAFVPLKKEITNATQAKLYKSLEIIKEAAAGAVMILNSEFASYYEDAILNKDKMKKEFLDMMYNLYDGEFQGTDTISTNRENISGIPVACIFMSDYKLLLENEKLANSFKSYLARGMARRSFIYFKKNENYYTEKIQYATFDEKNAAIKRLNQTSMRLKQIFDEIKEGKEYYFNQEANTEINAYKNEIDKKISEFYKYTNVLNIKREILKLNLEHSTWKIIKLAVLYHILETGGANTLIKADSFYKAVEFFNKTHKCLEILLGVKEMSDYEKLYNFLIKNCNKWISRMELRSQQFVPNAQFKNWIEDALIAVSEIAEIKSFCLARRASGRSNQGVEIALYDVVKYRFDSKQDGGVIKGELVKRDNKDLYTKEI